METAARWALGIGLFFLAVWLADERGWGKGAWVLAVALFFAGNYAITEVVEAQQPETPNVSIVPAPRTFVPGPIEPEAPATPEEAPTIPECHPSYSGCVRIASDVDCAGGSGNGPAYTGRVTVIGPDVYGLDRDNDGVGCE